MTPSQAMKMPAVSFRSELGLPPAGQQERAPEGAHRADASERVERSGRGAARRSRRGAADRAGRGDLARASRAAGQRQDTERSHGSPSRCESGWRERVGIEPTGAAEGASVAVLKTGQTTRPDPLPSRSGR